METLLRASILSLSLIASAVLGAETADETGGAASRREDVFEFTQEPSCKKTDSGQYEIRFASKGRCDVTVAVANRADKIVRHLVSGVLGANAPEPLKKDSLEQTLLWDGKDDFGKSVENPADCHVRVSLGLKPVVDKILMWHENRFEGDIAGIASDADGVYVFGAARGGGKYVATRIVQYDHQGQYLKTLLPFPKGKMLSGNFARMGEDFGGDQYSLPKGDVYPAEYAFCVNNHRLTMIQTTTWFGQSIHFFRLGTDGSLPPGGYFGAAAVTRVTHQSGVGLDAPAWLAVTPDDKYYYYTGTGFAFHQGPDPKLPDHAIYRIATDLNGKETTPFIGQKEAGSDNDHFNVPMGMTVDAEGQLYVADSGNNRIQVFSSDGKFVRTIAVPEPWWVGVHPKTHAVYVLSYPANADEYKILKFLDKPEPVATQSFAIPTMPKQKEKKRVWPVFCLDCSAATPTVWVTDAKSHIQLWEDKDSKFELKRDLYEEMIKESPSLANLPGRGANRWQPIVDPCRPYIYLGGTSPGWPAIDSTGTGTRINVNTGEIDKGRVPFIPGNDGLGYSLVDDKTMPVPGYDIPVKKVNPRHFEMDTGKIVPFENADANKCQGVYRMLLSPLGEMAIQCRTFGDFTPSTYPGRPAMLPKPDRPVYSSALLAKFDRQGKLINSDLLQGLPVAIAGIAFDLKGNIYVGLPLQKLVDGKPLSDFAIAKFPPEGGKFVYSAPIKQVDAPLQDRPQRKGDFSITVNENHKEFPAEIWADGMLWSYGSTLAPPGISCRCFQTWFSIDLYARSFVPEGSRSTVSIVDTNGNFILRIGGWGNCDERGPEVRLSYIRYVGVGDSGLYIDDQHNCRMLKVALKYEKEKDIALNP
jgi:hypothetical protein